MEPNFGCDQSANFAVLRNSNLAAVSFILVSEKERAAEIV